ncbi:nucleotidyltransferase domain-containing protein [Deinococcus sp. QL22]|uniref:nucleotidyltransferase domain-containing protein n=1 Tax=Deinococcus sp. QL22 TaxID=2939437 RepID=UPI002017CD45|nr:aminoglycoside nucleotidyltransferase ANT(2'')-Ia [Deinococcus sp. QL22]UQN08634.1 aminoglycoside nucleotidyltransferase ANT(2'')-Ia [Deinococcus sp. QL22]
MNQAHLNLMSQVVFAAARLDLPVWIGGGWAIDARLGRITREHDDIDLTFPVERRGEFETLIVDLQGRITAELDYGFLAEAQGVLLDCEPAHWNGVSYEIDDAPPGSCPEQIEGHLEGLALRCNSWEALMWDYFFYADEVPRLQWPAKHTHSYALARSALGEEAMHRLRAAFKLRHCGMGRLM